MVSASSNRQTSIGYRLAPWLPWTDGTGRRWRGWRHLFRAAPFSLGYLVASWAIFVPIAEPRGGKYWIDEEALGHLLYHVPDLGRDFPRAIRSLLTAPWLNHDSLQLIYVTVLLLMFGVVFESLEGTVRTVVVFFGTTFVSAVGGGALLHVVYPELWDTPLLENAWNRSWSGGSVGCFGLMGALAGRARRPGLLVAVFLLWEAFIWTVNLRNYTSVFHLTALTAGFMASRYMLPTHHREDSPHAG